MNRCTDIACVPFFRYSARSAAKLTKMHMNHESTKGELHVELQLILKSGHCYINAWYNAYTTSNIGL